MRNHALGRTGLFVSTERLVGQALDAGINFIDTADVYSGGQSKEITGQALKNLKVPRDSIVVATKVYGETGKGANSRGLTRSSWCVTAMCAMSACRTGPRGRSSRRWESPSGSVWRV